VLFKIITQVLLRNLSDAYWVALSVGTKVLTLPLMNENIIAWNVTNWVTVILMAAIGFFLVGIGLKWWSNRKGQNAPVGSINTTNPGARSIA